MSRFARYMATLFGSKVIVSDTFTRADSNTTLGNAETGQAWSISGTAVYGIASNKAKRVSGSVWTFPYIDAGVPDCSMSVTLSVKSATEFWIIRMVDATNFLMVQHSAGSLKFYLYKCVNDTLTGIATSGNCTNVNGDVLKFVLSGTSIKLYQNGTLRIDTTDSTHQTGTKFGFGCSDGNTISRFDDFIVEAL